MMGAKYLAEIRARDDAELPETVAPVFRDRHALLAEVERLQNEVWKKELAFGQLTHYNAAKDQQIATLTEKLKKTAALGTKWADEILLKDEQIDTLKKENVNLKRRNNEK